MTLAAAVYLAGFAGAHGFAAHVLGLVYMLGLVLVECGVAFAELSTVLYLGSSIWLLEFSFGASGLVPADGWAPCALTFRLLSGAFQCLCAALEESLWLLQLLLGRVDAGGWLQGALATYTSCFMGGWFSSVAVFCICFLFGECFVLLFPSGMVMLHV